MEQTDKLRLGAAPMISNVREKSNADSYHANQEENFRVSRKILNRAAILPSRLDFHRSTVSSMHRHLVPKVGHVWARAPVEARCTLHQPRHPTGMDYKVGARSLRSMNLGTAAFIKADSW